MGASIAWGARGERQFSPINNLIKKTKILSEDLGIML
jgi:hypothetical protein